MQVLLRNSNVAAAALLFLAFVPLAGAQEAKPIAGARINACRVGFDGVYKLGYWTPVSIELAGGTPGATVTLELIAPDDDGVRTAVRTPAEDPIQFDADGNAVASLLTKIGRADATLRVNLLDTGKVVATRRFACGEAVGTSVIPPGRPAGTNLLVHVGNTELGLSQAYLAGNPDSSAAPRQVVRLSSLENLPTTWSGYDAVDHVVISADSQELFADVASDDPRLAALGEWVEMGGRLVVLCGRQGEQLLAAGGPLVRLVPGEFVESVPVDRADALEQYSAAADSVMGDVRLSVPRLENVRGRVEAAEGNLPLVVRAPRGFGQVVFAGFDLDRGPLAEWPGRRDLLRRLLDRDDADTAWRTAASGRLTTRGYDDLAGALRQRLGEQFAGVTGVPFGLVALLAVGYLALVGPVDYYLVRRVLGRMEWTWVTLPAMILLVSWGVYALAVSRKGSERRVNQVEVVDFDLTGGRARGTMWATLYSPQATTYDLTLAARRPDGRAVDDPTTLVSWFGMPGTGLGGMSARGGSRAAIDATYRYGPQLAELENVPVETWSTKTFTARWSAAAPRLIAGDLVATVDGLVEGTVQNNAGAPLADARLLYGTWGWRLGDLPAGGSVTIDTGLDPLKVRTLLTSRVRNAVDAPRDRGPFHAEQADVNQLLDLMMFYDATGGRRFSRLANQYQAHCDLSHLLDLGRAILLARGELPGSEFLDHGEPIGANADRRWTVYRFVIPVNEEQR